MSGENSSYPRQKNTYRMKGKDYMADLDYTQYGERLLDDDGYSIKELIDIILVHIKLILTITIIAGFLAFIVSQFFITPQYESSAKLFVNNSRAGQTDTTSISDLNASERLVNTYMEIVKSNTVLSKVAKDIVLEDNKSYSVESLKKMVTTQAVKNTEIFYVKVTSSNPQHAMIIANQIAADAPEEIMDFVEATSVKVIDHASLAKSQSSPNVKLNTAIGLLLGLVLSILLVLVLDMIDVTIRSDEDIKLITELPILGVIPSIDIALENGRGNIYGGRYGY